MQKKAIIAIFALIIIIAFASSTLFAAESPRDFFKHQASLVKNIKTPLAGGQRPTMVVPSSPYNSTQTLGIDEIPTESPGMLIGTTTHDFQHNGRTNRQVDWRGSEFVHFIWFKQLDSITPGGDGGTGYEVWDTDAGALLFQGTGGGCDIHPRLGGGNNFSGYIGIDVDTESKVVITNHHDEGAGYASTVWYDFTSGACFFSPYKRRLPDTTMQYGVTPTELDNGEWRFVWPAMEYQVFGGDTVTHVIAHQLTNEIRPSKMHYYRRVGSDTLGYWEYPPVIIDTVPVIGEQITASRVSGKVAIAWLAPPGAYPGDPESMERDWLDPGLGVNQRTNDIYTIVSNDMGASWGSKSNISAYDSTVGGWLGHSDLSCLIDTDDILHIIWPAREIVPADEGLGEYTHFWGSRLLHWDEFNDVIRPIKDANWDLPDSGCTGGSWNEMSIVKPQISECNGKFYTIFVMFNDIYNGIDNDCADGRYDGTYSYSGTANGDLYLSVSDNGGLNWDIARNLTQSYTPHCDPDGAGGLVVCDADQYPSMSRFGMQVVDGDFTGVPVVIPEGGAEGDYYLDVEFINDKFPGSVFQNDGVWSTNPVLWFRVPCVEPVPNPVPIVNPFSVDFPTWTKTSMTLDTTFYFENVGNADLVISSITPVGLSDAGAITVDNSGPVTISSAVGTPPFELGVSINAVPNTISTPSILSGYIEYTSNYLSGSTDSVYIECIIADTLQFPEFADVRTECTRITFSNAGNIGNSGIGDYNLDFFDDCDTTGNDAGDDDRASVYLYESSPFICWIDGTDTLMNYSIFDADWTDDQGFIPLYGPTADSTSFADYQYGYSNRFGSNDTSLIFTSEYYAPKTGNCNFVVVKQTVANNTGSSINNMFFGEVMDWDIPSDSGSANGSDYNEALQFMFCFGAEYDADSIVNDDCILADQRYGGFSYYLGYKYRDGEASDSIGAPKAMWTENNADWVYPSNGLVAQQIYSKCASTDGYEIWEATGDFTNPDSMYTDLHMVSVFGQFDLGANDTLTFYKIYVTEYDGGESAITTTVENARAWIANHPVEFPLIPVNECCCQNIGNANGDANVNILDITFMIAFLYQGGAAPPCPPEADINGDCKLNILDITGTIGYLYQGMGINGTCESNCQCDYGL